MGELGVLQYLAATLMVGILPRGCSRFPRAPRRRRGPQAGDTAGAAPPRGARAPASSGAFRAPRLSSGGGEAARVPAVVALGPAWE